MTARNNAVIAGSPKEVRNEDAEWLVYDWRQGQQRPHLPLDRDDVLFSHCDDLRNLYQVMLEHLKERLPRIDTEQLLTDMWAREEDYTSLLGNGIALPHAWTSDVDQTRIVVARPQSDSHMPPHSTTH